jgi:ribosomal protein L40E
MTEDPTKSKPSGHNNNDEPSDGEVIDDPVYEMFWDCEYCGTPELLGKTHRHCPACGALQDSERRYFPPKDKRVAVENHVYYGADKICRGCENANSAKAEFCGACGAGLNDSALANSIPNPSSAPASRVVAKPAGSSKLRIILTIIVITAIALICWNYYFTRVDQVKVVSHHWKRSVVVEEYSRVTKSSWCDNLPASTQVLRRTREVKSKRKVEDGQTCSSVQIDNRDGTFRTEKRCKPKYRYRDEYGDKCFYHQLVWLKHDTKKLAEDGLEPRWPRIDIEPCSRPAVGCLREGRRSERYFLRLDFAGKIEECKVPIALWQSASVGETLSAEISGLTSAVKCGTLRVLKED